MALQKRLTCDAAVGYLCAAKHQFEGNVGHKDTKTQLRPGKCVTFPAHFAIRLSHSGPFQRALWKARAKMWFMGPVFKSFSNTDPRSTA